jgi:hypothetical protein
MASNDEHLAIHLTACILGYQFHLRLETNASVSLNMSYPEDDELLRVMGRLATSTQLLARDSGTRYADAENRYTIEACLTSEVEILFVPIR